mmetsp:Transcript_76789/g.225430  ORF Transcript_76789/g.225430 Transcript_76789/m.225430 type:complete len:297 (-) Transcript_76789:427-1317(-)
MWNAQIRLTRMHEVVQPVFQMCPLHLSLLQCFVQVQAKRCSMYESALTVKACHCMQEAQTQGKATMTPKASASCQSAFHQIHPLVTVRLCQAHLQDAITQCPSRLINVCVAKECRVDEHLTLDLNLEPLAAERHLDKLLVTLLQPLLFEGHLDLLVSLSPLIFVRFTLGHRVLEHAGCDVRWVLRAYLPSETAEVSARPLPALRLSPTDPICICAAVLEGEVHSSPLVLSVIKHPTEEDIPPERLPGITTCLDKRRSSRILLQVLGDAFVIAISTDSMEASLLGWQHHGEDLYTGC